MLWNTKKKLAKEKNLISMFHPRILWKSSIFRNIYCSNIYIDEVSKVLVLF